MSPELSPGAARGVIVTGGAQGIGRAVVARLLARGDRVVAADADEEAGAELLALHPDAAERLWFEAVDVAEEAQVARLVARTVARCGRLDALVSNAGVGDRTPLADLSYHAWQRVLGVNLGGAFLGAKHAAPHLREAGGAIVNIASTRALQSEPDSEAYAASKGGLLALTHALAMSLAPEVRVNAVSPGWIEVRDRQKRAAREEPRLRERDHRQHPAGRVGRPEDVAAAVDYLLSDDAGFVTGHNLVVDGGMTRKMIYEP